MASHKIYYKAFDSDMTCQRYQFSVGKSYSVDGDLSMCSNGFHICKNIIDCLNYYPRESRFCEIEIISKDYRTDGNKTLCRSIKVVREIVGDELIYLLSQDYERLYEDGQVEYRCSYIDGKREGKLEAFHKGGQPDYHCFYKGGEKEGESIKLYPDGQIWYRYNYKNGKLDGDQKEWYPNEQLSSQNCFRDGKLNGDQKSWYTDGQQEYHHRYRDGLYNGKQEAWKKNGEQRYLRLYKDGDLQ